MHANLDLAQTLTGFVKLLVYLRYNALDVEAQVAVVQYLAVIPYLVETVLRRNFRLNQGHQR